MYFRSLIRLFFILALSGAATPSLAERYTNPLGMDFQPLPAGEFIMGSADLDPIAFELPDGDVEQVRDETPAHRVRFDMSVLMQTTEVTQGQWLEIMGSRPGPEAYWKREDWERLPVVSVSWHDTQAFIDKLNTLDPDADYRLPTEAEWEYAARAGTSGLRPVSNEALTEYAWFIENSGDIPHPVASRQANPWGLHDMFGNVWEWVNDWYAPRYYAHSPELNPQGPSDGSMRVRRGGSHHCGIHLVRPGYRSADTPDTAYSVIGFRLVAMPKGG